jgi:LPXTG-motif cell wall-anchored protein
VSCQCPHQVTSQRITKSNPKRFTSEAKVSQNQPQPVQVSGTLPATGANDVAYLLGAAGLGLAGLKIRKIRA